MANKIRNTSVTVVIPAKNEAGGIAEIISEVRLYCGEVIVVDGNSTDETAKISKQSGATVWSDGGRGKGAAYKVGLQRALGDVVVFMDADGSHDPSDIPNLVRPILNHEADLVIASRHKGGSDEWEGDLETYIRHVGSGILTLSMNYRWGGKLTDCLNGFRALKREIGLKIPIKADNFDVEQHMIAQFLKHGFKVTEVMSHESCRKWGKSKLPTYRKAYLFFWRLFLDLVTPKDF